MSIILPAMKTQYYTASTLDGFIATEDDSLDWLFPLGDVNASSYPAFIAGVGALAMGASTYEWLLRNGDAVAKETGSPWPYSQPAWVFSHRVHPAIEGADIRFVAGDVRQVHADMKAAAGAGTSGSSAAASWPVSSTTLACSMSSSCRSARRPWGVASRCCRVGS